MSCLDIPKNKKNVYAKHHAFKVGQVAARQAVPVIGSQAAMLSLSDQRWSGVHHLLQDLERAVASGTRYVSPPPPQLWFCWAGAWT